MRTTVSAALPRSIRAQLVLWNILTLALLLGILGLVIHFLVRSFMLRSIDRELAHRTQLLVSMPPPPGEGPPGRGPRPGFPLPPFRPGPPLGEPDGPFRVQPPRFLAAGDRFRPRRYDLRGRSLPPGSPTQPLHRPAFEAAARGESIYSTTSTGGQPVRLLSRPFPEGRQPMGVIQAAYPLTELRRAIAGLDRALLTLIPVALLCAGLGGFLLTDRVLRPVRRLTQAAGRIGAEDLSQRLPVAGQEDEFGELAVTFNGMLGRLEEAFQDQQRLVEQLRRLVEQQRRFTADASHELRTPLTVIKANTSLCKSGSPTPDDYQQSVEDIDRAAESMSRLVQDLLLLARSDGGHLGQNRIELPIKEVLERAASGLPRQEHAPIRIEVTDAALCVHGNEDELVRLFANLLANAIVPPCAATMLLQMERPRPVPPSSRERAGSTR